MLVGDDGGGEQDQRGSDAEPEAGAAGERVAGAVDELCAEHRVRDAPRVLRGSGDGLPDGLPLGAGTLIPHYAERPACVPPASRRVIPESRLASGEPEVALVVPGGLAEDSGEGLDEAGR